MPCDQTYYCMWDPNTNGFGSLQPEVQQAEKFKSILHAIRVSGLYPKRFRPS